MNNTDVVIAGSGAAGMMAGITLARAGFSVVILEKGGSAASSNAAKAGGPALANTPMQEKENALVTEKQLFDHMYGFSRGTVHAGLLRNAISEGREAYDILERNGIEMTLLPDTYGVGFRARHMLLTRPKERWGRLQRDFEAHGGEILFGACADSIVMEGGKVKGVCYTREGKQEFLSGRQVIIATGGYLGSQEEQEKHFGKSVILPLGSTLSSGDGIWMGLNLGGIKDRNWGICSNEFSGANHKMKGISGVYFYAVCGGLLVNSQGRRFMNEQLLSDQPLSVGGEVALREGRYYAVADQDMVDSLFHMTPYEFYGSPEAWKTGKNSLNDRKRCPKAEDFEKGIEKKVVFKLETLEEGRKVPGLKKLPETVMQYNQLCAEGEDRDFGKAAWLLKSVKKAPYYLFEYESSAWCTFGGLKTDEYTRLLDEDNQVVPGVYVAGVDNGSCYCVPYYDNEGAALGLAMTTGIVAAKHIIQSNH